MEMTPFGVYHGVWVSASWQMPLEDPVGEEGGQTLLSTYSESHWMCLTASNP